MRLAEGVGDRARRLVMRRALAASLYPTPHAELRRPLWRKLLTPTLAVVVGTAAQVIRLTGTKVFNTVWAEDGTIFLRDALGKPAQHAVFHTYAGYLHLVPRTIAEVARAVPIDDAAIVMGGGAALVIAVLAVVVFRASRDVIASTPLRLVLAASMIVLPATARETLDNTANLHWYLIFAAFWVLLWRPASRTERFVGCVVLVSAALSDPLTLVLAPLALARWVTLPHRGERAFTVTYAAAMAVQLGFALLAEANPVHLAPNVGDLAKVYGLRVAAASLLGDPFTNRLFLTLGWALAWIGGAAVLAVVVFGLRRWNGRRAVVALAVFTSSAVFLIPMILRWEDSIISTRGSDTLGGGSRYMVVPVLLLIGAFVVIADHAGQRWRQAPVASVVAIALAFTWGQGFLVRNERSLGPLWSTVVAHARTECTSGVENVTVPISPQSPPGKWVVPIPCARLLSSGS